MITKSRPPRRSRAGGIGRGLKPRFLRQQPSSLSLDCENLQELPHPASYTDLAYQFELVGMWGSGSSLEASCLGRAGDPGDPPLDRVTGQGPHSKTPMNRALEAKNAVHGDPGDPIFAVCGKIFYSCWYHARDQLLSLWRVSV